MTFFHFQYGQVIILKCFWPSTLTGFMFVKESSRKCVIISTDIDWKVIFIYLFIILNYKDSFKVYCTWLSFCFIYFFQDLFHFFFHVMFLSIITDIYYWLGGWNIVFVFDPPLMTRMTTQELLRFILHYCLLYYNSVLGFVRL